MEFLVALFTNKIFVLTILCVGLSIATVAFIGILVLIIKRSVVIEACKKKITIRLEDL